MLATNSLFNFSFVRTEGSSRNSGISATSLPRSPRTRRAHSLPGGGAALPPPSLPTPAREQHRGAKKKKKKLAHTKQRPDTKAPEQNCGPSAAKIGAHTNPSPHTTAEEGSLLRPRPKIARRHWRAAAGSAPAIGGTPRAGSISRGALREGVETQFKRRSGGSRGAGPVSVSLFSTLPLRY